VPSSGVYTRCKGGENYRILCFSNRGQAREIVL
jgi:hypothetical protein